MARWDLRRYRSRGPGPSERRLLETVHRHAELEGARVLEIGGGIGALQTELLLAGAATGEVVELVGAYEPYARELAADRGLTDRTRFRVLDLLAAAPEGGPVEPAEVVLLNRVVCCSADGPELVGVAAGLTRGVQVLSFPRNRWWLRTASASQNALFRLLRRSFRTWVRPADWYLEAAEQRGLELVSRGRGAVWEYIALQRPRG